MHSRLAVAGLVLVALTGCVASTPSDPPPSGPPTSLRSLVSPGMPRWRSLADAPEARQEVAAALVGDRVYVAGGLTASGASKRVDVYDVAKNVWSRAPDLPVALHHAAGAGFQGIPWVIGGFDASSRPLASVYTLVGQGSAQRWVPAPPLREPRAAPAAAVVGERIVVAGGQGTRGLVAATEVFEPIPKGAPNRAPGGRWVAKSPIPTRRHHLAAAVAGTQVYFSGGRAPQGGPPDRNVNAFERYDLAKDEWTKLPGVPTSRSGHGSGLLDGKVVVVGGEDPANSGGPSVTVTDAFDPASGQWTRTFPAMFRARHGVGAVVHGDALYVMLGGSRVGLAPASDSDALVVP